MNTRWKWCFGIPAVLMVVGAALVARAQWIAKRSYADVPLPPITAAHSPEALARGEFLFQSLCMECHAGADGRATGKYLDEVPAFLGKFYSANLAHPEHGVTHRSDGELARVLRFGVLPDGRLSPLMNSFGHLGDADVAAILGYVRSGAEAFEPAGEEQPQSELTVTGTMILTYVAGMNVERPVEGIPVPPKAPNVEYGRYMAQTLDCVGCHTDGFGSSKMTQPNAFAGGFELTDPTGTPIYTKNITFDEKTGIGRWSLSDFDAAVTRGVTPDGVLVRKPMPLFSRLDDVDTEALYVFLRSMPHVLQGNKPGGHPVQKVKATDTAEELFVNTGCVACHGEARPYRDKLKSALDKPDADVAAWILDPQAVKPGALMPSFQGTLTSSQAEQLAQYVKKLVRGGEPNHGG